MKTCYEYNGCYWHGDAPPCPLNRPKTRKQERTSITRRDRTINRESTITKLGYRVITMKECVWQDMKRNDEDVKHFIKHVFNKRYVCNDTISNTDEILNLVRTDKLFGMVECDISIPQNSLYCFGEMAPIFRTTQVNIDEIGTHMKQFLREHDISTTSKKTLVGGLSAKKMLLSTPLLRWYIQQRMVITNISLIIES